MSDDPGNKVFAVPPLARHADLTPNRAANAALIRHIEAGGVRALMYGGNANFYNIGLYEYAAVVDQLLELAAPGTWVIPSVGPDFGKMMDQAWVLRGRPFPTAMVLPAAANFSPAGVDEGIRRFTDRLGKPAILYLRAEAYISPAGVERLVADKRIKAIKYAIIREDPRRDSYLGELVERVDRNIVISGMGERPAVVHLADFRLASFTSGSVCIAPRLSAALLEALRRGDRATAERLHAAFMPLEDCRDAHNPVRVLHEAVTLAGIADMGPVLPLMSNLEPEHHDKVREAARVLRALNDRPLSETA
jgi:dihydrodipicolinate synthase/N-acetylneuraminate lyase